MRHPMSVRNHLFILVLTCAVVGVGLTIGLEQWNRRIDRKQFEVGNNSLAIKDIQHLEESLDRLFVTADLVIGAGETYLAEPARVQIQQLHSLIDGLHKTKLFESDLDTLNSLNADIQKIDAIIVDVAQTPSIRVLQEKAQSVFTYDIVSQSLVTSVENLRSKTHEKATRMQYLLERERTHLRTVTLVGILFYIGLTLYLCRWAWKTVAAPIHCLNRAATSAMVHNEPFNPVETGPSEIRLLSQSIAQFVGLLERKVAERTLDLQAKTTSLENKFIELNRTKEELGIAKRTAELASQAKSDFLANMSHEIRTPLNAVIGYCSLMEQTELSSEQRKFSEIIQVGANTVIALIDDILDFSKIEAGKTELDPRPFEIHKCIQDCVDLVSSNAFEKNLKIICHISDNSPGVFIGDVTRIRQVLLNILNNAIKFTSTGHIAIHVRSQRQEDGKYKLVFSVKDTGIGIPSDKIGLVFDSFRQADTSTTRRFGGSGLGLAISKRLVEMMDGHIWATSELNSGSNFNFCVIVEPSVITNPTQHTNQSVEPLKWNGENLTTLPIQSRSSSRPHPTESRQAVPTQKPVSNLEHPLDILVAEDTFVNQQLTILRLTKMGHHADLAVNGKEVLKALKQKKYDVILMDIQMPEMDGFEATRTINSEWKKEDRPRIIAMTANASEEEKTRCLNTGMEAFLTKPVKADVLRAALDNPQ